MVVATERPPDVDFLPGWKEVFSGDLEVRHLKGHHRDLFVEPAIQALADVILSAWTIRWRAPFDGWRRALFDFMAHRTSDCWTEI